MGRIAGACGEQSRMPVPVVLRYAMPSVGAVLEGEGEEGAPRGSYMEARLARVAEQAGGAVDDLFGGMCVYIDGHTGECTAAALVAHIYRHGGTTLLAPAMSRVTHILATHLPPRKADAMLRRGGATRVPILRPAYIADCVAARRRLPEAPYSVLQDTTARRLSAMLPLRTPRPTAGTRPLDRQRPPIVVEHAGTGTDTGTETCNVITSSCSDDDIVTITTLPSRPPPVSSCLPVSRSPSPVLLPPPAHDGDDWEEGSAAGAASAGDETVDTIPASP